MSPSPDVEESYRLIAVVGGTEIESETFVPAETARVRWEMKDNRLIPEPASEREIEADRDTVPPPGR